MKAFAVAILSVIATGLLAFFTWIVTDIQAQSRINATQDVKIEYTNKNIEEIRKDLKEIKTHLIKRY